MQYKQQLVHPHKKRGQEQGVYPLVLAPLSYLYQLRFSLFILFYFTATFVPLMMYMPFASLPSISTALPWPTYTPSTV